MMIMRPPQQLQEHGCTGSRCHRCYDWFEEGVLRFAGDAVLWWADDEPDRRDPRREEGVVCFGDAAVQHHDLDGGRLTLNVLLSFAQFEREVIGKRIRDKIAASKKKGMRIGGVPPLGYRVHDRKLVIVDSEAKLVRSIFRRYAELGSCGC